MPTIQAVMPQPLVDALDRIAEREGKSRSAVVVAACERACEVRGEWPPGRAGGGVDPETGTFLPLPSEMVLDFGIRIDTSAVVHLVDGSYCCLRSGAMLTGGCFVSIAWIGPKCDPGWVDALRVHVAPGEVQDG